jgi:hypothetical protein
MPVALRNLPRIVPRFVSVFDCTARVSPRAGGRPLSVGDLSRAAIGAVSRGSF